MFNKNEDTFFNETSDTDKASEDLMNMISNYTPTTTSDISAGSKVQGTVTRIGTEYVYFDIGGKLEAIMNIKECRDKDNTITVKIGDILSGYVL